MRVFGILLALIGIFIGIMGLGGSSVLCFISLAPLILGGLLFSAANRRAKAETEERRHREVLDAMKR